MGNRTRRDLTDLAPYSGCPEDSDIGLEPLAVGWLRRGQAYETGHVPAGFTANLLAFCLEAYTVCHTAGTGPCPFCGVVVPPVVHNGRQATFGAGEIRVIGEVEVYAAPTLIYHYVMAHRYRPPAEFVDAVMQGPPAGSVEHRALVNSYR